jgi:glycosyltransferase involved in cell wall biosynthesis
MTLCPGMRDRGEVRATIVMPAYNAEQFIERALFSALSQTESRCEVVVVDDASVDRTAEVVTSIAAQDDRVRLLRNPTNLGPAASRNRGIGEARGVWIALLDADDEIMSHRIYTLMALGDQHGADMVADNLLLCPENTPDPVQPMLSPDLIPEDNWLSPAEFVFGNIGSRHTPRVSYGFLKPIIRSSFLRAHGLRYSEDNRFGEDFLLYTGCLLNGAHWWLTPEPMYRYRVRSGSLSETASPGDLKRISVLNERVLRTDPMVASDADLAEALRRHQAKIDRWYYYIAFAGAVKAGALDQAGQLLFESAASFRYIFLESIAQAPKITRKALRGGYRRKPALAGHYG